MNINHLANLSRYVPELILVVLMVALIIVESSYRENEKNKRFIFATMGVGLAASLFALIINLGQSPIAIYTNSMIIDPFSTIMKIAMVIGTFFSFYLSTISKDIYETLKSEYAIMSVGVLVGAFILASANNMLMLYIGIETLSILSYVMAAMKKNDDLSSEAGLKYVLYGGVTAGIMLVGMSHIFGVLGTIQFSGIVQSLAKLDKTQLLILMPSFLLFFAGIGYKIASVPFHMWSPDVYEGSPTPVTTFFAIVPKLAGISSLIRITMIFFAGDSVLKISWVGLIMAVAALTMTVGNLSAIGQKSVKRMLAYSSISHAGIMMAGIVILNDIGIRSIVFYGISYVFMTLVAFFITSIVADRYSNDHFERFTGLIYRYPLMAVLMSVTMFSLTGIPPMAGFVAKFNILTTLVSAKYYSLAIVLVLNSVISAYYYLKIVRLMCLKQQEANDEIKEFSFINQFVIAALSFPVLFIGIFWESILTFANGAKLFIQ